MNVENLDSSERLTHTYPIHRGPCKECASVVETGMLLVAGDIANCNSFRLIRIQAGNPTDTYHRIGNEVFFPNPKRKRKATGIPPKRTDLFVFKRIIFSSVKCAVERDNNRLKRKSIHKDSLSGWQHCRERLTARSLKFDGNHPVCQAGALVQFTHVGVIFAIDTADGPRTDTVTIARAPKVKDVEIILSYKTI